MQHLIALAPFVPLFQTLLWIVFALGLLFCFRRQTLSILRAIQRRIETGATVKAGWFELSEQIRPQTPEAQRKRLDDETKEVLGSQLKSQATETTTKPEDVRSQVVQSEDLAIRALQDEFGVPVNRQVTVGAGTPFDAAFFKDGMLFLVEVKTFLRPVDRLALQNTIARLIGYSDALPNLPKRYLLALVFRTEAEITQNEEKVILALGNFGSKVEVRMYVLRELQVKFGAAK